MPDDGLPGYLRYRVVNPTKVASSAAVLADGFETVGSTLTLFRSIGTDGTGTLGYWTTDYGFPSIASNVVTMVPGGSASLMHAGHGDWGDCTVRVRFQFAASTDFLLGIHGNGAKAAGPPPTYNNHIFLRADGTNIYLIKTVAGTQTTVNTTAASLSATTWHWLEIVCSGTSYTGNLYSDSGGSIGTVTYTTGAQTISNAGLQTGFMSLGTNTTQQTQVGGAFASVCTATGPTPSGWTPTFTTGEPAFCLSTVSPQAGTYSASIQLGNSAGNGSWQKTATLSGGTYNVGIQGKASAGTAATASVGAVTTGGAATGWAPLNGSGVAVANPLMSLIYTGAIGTAYFDALSITNPDPTSGEITNDLPHLHLSTWEIRAMQPGNPGSSALGKFTIPLHPPGSDGYMAAKVIYDSLDMFLRVEGYLSTDGSALGGAPKFAGFITGIDKQEGGGSSRLEITGITDLALANYSRPFPGEVLDGNNTTAPGSYLQAREFFGRTEVGWTDNFNPYTAANYNSTGGTWAASTDNGFNVVAATAGNAVALISKVGAIAGDSNHTHFVEVSGRLKPSVGSAMTFGVGLSDSPTAFSSAGVTSWLSLAQYRGANTGLDSTYYNYVNAALVANTTTTSVLTGTKDLDGYVSINICLWINNQDVQVTINGKTILGYGTQTITDPQLKTLYPFLYYSLSAAGDTAYYANLIQMVRYSDNQNPGAALFAPGTIGTATRTLPVNADPGPTFLDAITRSATREGWYWRYTPTAFIGTRTIGTFDMGSDPGTDRSNQCIFRRSLGNLVSLQLSANADSFTSGTAASGAPGTEGGGVTYWRDISTMTKYGVIEDQTLMVTAITFAEQQRLASQIVANKITTSSAGSKTAVLLRDSDTVDRWRELDRILIDDPDLGISNVTARVIGYTFTEGDPRQTVILDQFSSQDVNLTAKRLQAGVFQIANRFNTR